MNKKTKKQDKSEAPHIHGVVTVGSRGQVVIPVEARKKLDVKEGDKMIVLGGEDGMLILAKVDQLKEKIARMSKFIKPL